MSRKKPASKTNADLLCRLAASFRGVGIAVISEMGKNNHEPMLIAPAAVNMSMAIELYLKALHILFTKQHPPEGHHLWTLYKSLPQPLKISLEVDYTRAHKQNVPKYKAFRFVLRMATEPDGEQKAKIFDNVKELLVAHSRAFEQFRYLHEFGEQGYDYEFDFSSIDVFCEVIRAAAHRVLATRGSRFAFGRATKPADQ